MSTYAENAHQREIAARRVLSDAVMAKRHAEFDLSAQDNHSKSERPSFIVVTASKAYRRGWEILFGKTNGSTPESGEELSSEESVTSKNTKSGSSAT